VAYLILKAGRLLMDMEKAKPPGRPASNGNRSDASTDSNAPKTAPGAAAAFKQAFEARFATGEALPIGPGQDSNF